MPGALETGSLEATALTLNMYRDHYFKESGSNYPKEVLSLPLLTESWGHVLALLPL